MNQERELLNHKRDLLNRIRDPPNRKSASYVRVTDELSASFRGLASLVRELSTEPQPISTGERTYARIGLAGAWITGGFKG